MTTHPHATLKPPVQEADHVAGDGQAPITLVEYGDYQCPHCGAAHPIVKALQQRLGASLRVVFRNFPLAEMHPDALHAAEAAESVAAQAGNDAFWVMHDALFEHQDALDDASLARYAATSGANAAQTLSDLAADAYEATVRADLLSGARSGVNGTPTFFVNGVRFDGNWLDIEEFAAALVPRE